jgi:ANTAR domain
MKRKEKRGMSALLQYESFYRRFDRLTDLEATREISRIVHTATTGTEGLEALAASVLGVAGIQDMKIEDGALLAIFGARAWPAHAACPGAPAILALAEANGFHWGRLRLTVDPSARPEAARSLARFLGQQLALLLNRLDLIRQREIHLAQLRRLSQRLATRKKLHRASGLVARARGVSNHQALQILVHHARKSRRTLDRVAETVILGYEAPLGRRPTLRRLTAGELTR